jgi:hypothetical protein
MDRGNAKHGPRLDEAMARETETLVRGGGDARVEDRHDPEPPGEDQPGLKRAGTSREPGSPPGMTYGEVQERSRLGRFIPMAQLPGDREALTAGARDLNAPDDVLAELGRLPAGIRYHTVAEVWAALGHHNETRRT